MPATSAKTSAWNKTCIDYLYPIDAMLYAKNRWFSGFSFWPNGYSANICSLFAISSAAISVHLLPCLQPVQIKAAWNKACIEYFGPRDVLLHAKQVIFGLTWPMYRRISNYWIASGEKTSVYRGTGGSRRSACGSNENMKVRLSSCSGFCSYVIYSLRHTKWNCGDWILAIFNKYRSYGNG